MAALWTLTVICALFLVTVDAQTFHVIAPNTFRLDSTETIFIALEGKPSALVNVHIQDHPGKIKTIAQAQLQVNAGQVEKLEMRLDPSSFPPTFFTVPNAEKLVSLTVQSDNFLKEVVIPVTHQAGYVFIQTDKPIYTPKDRAFFRIIPLDEDALPSDKPFKLQIKNPKKVVVEETFFNDKMQKFRKVFVSHNFQFPRHVDLGEWSASVYYGHEMKQNTTIFFEVSEYVLPTFTVEVKTPAVILETDETIEFSVNAEYVYGKKVKGTVTYRLGVKGELPKATYFAVIGPKQLRDGSHHESVGTHEFETHQDVGWFPDIEGSRLVVEATVMEEATGNQEFAVDANGRFAKSPYEISFGRCLTDFKPGILSVFEADIKYVGGTPAQNVPVMVKATANGERINTTRATAVSDAEGKVAFMLHPQMQHSILSITLETVDPRYEGRQAVGHFIQQASQSKAFLALERSSSYDKKVGDMFVKVLHIEPAAMKDVYYAVVSKGRIVHVQKLPEGHVKYKSVEFELTHEMVPSFRLVVWAHYGDQLLADSLKMDIENACHPDAQVTLTPDENFRHNPEPGSEGKIFIQGKKSTLVGILGVDEAVYALSKRDLLTKAKIFKTMAAHDLGCGPGGGLSTDEVLAKAGVVIMTSNFSPKAGGSSCVAVKRRKRQVANEILDSYSGFSRECCALGLSQDAYGRDCETRRDIVVRYLQGRHPECSSAFYDCCSSGKDKGFDNMRLAHFAMGRSRIDFEKPLFIPPDEVDFKEAEALKKIRRDFRETWWHDRVIGPDGREEFALSLPHSITTWVVQAVSVSASHGVCVADPLRIVAFKKVFVQLNLPYSIVRNEQVEVQATVFNYGHNRLGAFVYLFGVQDLCTGTNEGERSERRMVQIERQSAVSVTFPVIPLKEGSFDVKVMASTPEGSDVVMRKLNVVPEGYPVEVDIPIQLDPSNQQKRKRRSVDTPFVSDSIDPSRNYQVTAIKLPMPQDFVPGTESCVITAVGDQFGPTIETALTEPDKLLRLPQGCGEQNMLGLAPTLYTMRYLKVKGKISPEIEEKGYSFIRTGYANQLTFRKKDGSYSAYQHKPTSTWLTAFVVKVFCQATELVRIDEHVLCSGVKWLVDHQQPDGSFVEMDPVYHMDMMGGVQGKTPLTAFALITMEECKCDEENLLISKKRALAYLEEHLGDVIEPLAVAIMSYAFSLSDSALKQAANDRLMSLAHFDEDMNTMFWGSGDNAQDIEATSYALLNRLLAGDMGSSNAIVNWLNSQRLQSGSFRSTQDTVVGLQALSEYAIRAQMPSMNLVSNISSSNDRNFHHVLNFREDNAHVLRDIKVNKVGGLLFVNTEGHGIGSMSVKLRYNVPHPPEKLLCKFDVKVNVTEVKEAAHQSAAGFGIMNVNGLFERFPEDLIRGVAEALNKSEDVPVLDGDPRNRGPKLESIVAARRLKRLAGQENSKITSRIEICTRYLGDKDPGMSIVDVGIFSGFTPHEEDLSDLQGDDRHLIDRFEKSSRGVVFYLKTIPRNKDHCFSFHVTRQYMVGKTQSSIVKVYDYYNPGASCSVFYSPGTNSPILRTLCERGGVCQCAEGGCPPKDPFSSVMLNDDLSESEKRIELRNMACDNYDFVWKGFVLGEPERQNGFFNISFEIDEVIKEGIEKKELIEKETRHFLVRDNCAPLLPQMSYLIMGKDGQKYKNEQGQIWHRYLLDKTSAVHMWTEIKVASNKKLQKFLNSVVSKLEKSGCLT